MTGQPVRGMVVGVVERAQDVLHPGGLQGMAVPDIADGAGDLSAEVARL